jgi:hypothetical protein
MPFLIVRFVTNLGEQCFILVGHPLLPCLRGNSIPHFCLTDNPFPTWELFTHYGPARLHSFTSSKSLPEKSHFTIPTENPQLRHSFGSYYRTAFKTSPFLEKTSIYQLWSPKAKELHTKDTQDTVNHRARYHGGMLHRLHHSLTALQYNCTAPANFTKATSVALCDGTGQDQ